MGGTMLPIVRVVLKLSLVFLCLARGFAFAPHATCSGIERQLLQNLGQGCNGFPTPRSWRTVRIEKVLVLHAVALPEPKTQANETNSQESFFFASYTDKTNAEETKSTGLNTTTLLAPKVNKNSVPKPDEKRVLEPKESAQGREPVEGNAPLHFFFPNSMSNGDSLDERLFKFPLTPTRKLARSFEQARAMFLVREDSNTVEQSNARSPVIFGQLVANTTARIAVPLTTLYKMVVDQTKVSRNGTHEAGGTSAKVFESSNRESNATEPETLSLRRLWRRRHARTLEEGIRREKATELSNLLNRAQIDARRPEGRKYIERTLMGLINALAEEVEDLDIGFTTKAGTPLWRKEVQEIRINFSRLGFKPIRIGGSDKYDRKGNVIVKAPFGDNHEGLSLVESADEAFDRIDKDKSGTLDQSEIAEALSMISELETDKESIEELASELVNLYDVNSDGVVDREEYQQMVEDMAKLRPPSEGSKNEGPLKKVKDSVQSISKGISEKAAQVAAAASGSGKPEVDPNEREMGSIVFSDLNLDLRRLFFGGLPVVKRITPGGPLILEPFTATIRGSFTREDVMGSFLLDAGLRLLVARAIRVRVRSFRDVVDGAYFFGRQWKMASKTAPVVQVLGLSNVEFSNDKMILTGRARIRTSPDAPVVTNTFKVRTKIGTGNNGQTIGLREPELAFVFECPQAWENGLAVVCGKLGLDSPKRPEPYYSFFPIYSPFKVNENAGFDMGEDNQLRKIFIKDGKLRFEMRSVLRPGRFLGSHYLAFTLPMRTFIITMDRVKEGIRVARKNKKIAEREKRLLAQTNGSIEPSKRSFSGKRILQSLRGFASRRQLRSPSFRLKPKQKSFFTRFVEGYTLVEREGEAKNEQLTNEISDWFGRQGQGNARSNGTGAILSDVAIGSVEDS